MKTVPRCLACLAFVILYGSAIASAQCPTTPGLTTTVHQGVGQNFHLPVNNPAGHEVRFAVFYPGATNGTVEMLNQSTGEVRYTPTFGYCGQDEFAYDVRSLTDPTCSGSFNRVRITVECNQCPEAIDTSVSVRRGVSTQIQLQATDPENNEIFFRDYFPFPSHGTVIVDSTGVATYTPDPGYCGPDLFWFRVGDTFNSSFECYTTNSGSAARVTIDVRCNECPTAADVHVSAVRGSSVVFQLTGADLDGDPLTYTYNPPGVNCGSITSFLPGGEVTYSTSGCGDASTQFTYRVSDGQCLSDEATVYITISDPMPVDIKPGSCPNPLSAKDQGLVSVAILGTVDFGVQQIDPSTVRLEGVVPTQWSVEDVGTPHAPFIGKSGCLDCHRLKRDKRKDLSLKFKPHELLAALGSPADGECRTLRLTATLFDGTTIVGEDVVRIQRTSASIISDGEIETGTDGSRITDSFILEQNYPNPFNPDTRISYGLPEAGYTRLAIYDMLGREVDVLVDREQQPGYYTVIWDARHMSGGMYYFKITTIGNDGALFHTQARKLLLIK